MNRVILIGRLTKDPEIRQGDTTYGRFSLAVDRRREGVDFINCVAFGRTADFIGKYFHKGQKMALTGRIQTGSYTNRDGKRITTTDVIADEVEFVEKRELNEPNLDTVEETERTATGFVPNETGFVPADELNDDGLPFA